MKDQLQLHRQRIIDKAGDNSVARHDVGDLQVLRHPGAKGASQESSGYVVRRAYVAAVVRNLPSNFVREVCPSDICA